VSKFCAVTGQKCSAVCPGHKGSLHQKALTLPCESEVPQWYKPSTLPELFTLVTSLAGMKVYYVVGHTGVGVYNDAPYEVYVDMKRISSLYEVKQSTETLSLGANVHLTDVIATFTRSSKNPAFKHLASLATLISRVAHVSVRNVSIQFDMCVAVSSHKDKNKKKFLPQIGSWAGNLAMKNSHKEFPSDVFTAFTVASARILLGQLFSCTV
jgi:xanthine dehydrogenase/oxidase